jgi:hypothetical protein
MITGHSLDVSLMTRRSEDVWAVRLSAENGHPRLCFVSLDCITAQDAAPQSLSAIRLSKKGDEDDQIVDDGGIYLLLRPTGRNTYERAGLMRIYSKTDTEIPVLTRTVIVE